MTTMLDQLSAINHRKIERKDGLLKPGSQADQIYVLLADSGKPLSRAEINEATGIHPSSAWTAIRRLKILKLIRQVGDRWPRQYRAIQ